MASRLEDTWVDRECPVMVALAEMSESGDGFVGWLAKIPEELVERYGKDGIYRAAVALTDGGYITAHVHRGEGRILSVMVDSITERGRRAVGLWPPDENAKDVLLAALAAAEEKASGPDRNALGKAIDVLQDVGTGTIAGVMSYFATRHGL